jgi:hypothetical protein
MDAGFRPVFGVTVEVARRVPPWPMVYRERLGSAPSPAASAPMHQPG